MKRFVFNLRCDNEAHVLDVGKEVDASRPLTRKVYRQQKPLLPTTKAEVSSLEPLVDGAASLLAMPIPGFEGHPQGILDLESREEHAFDYYTENVMRAVANLVGLSYGLERLLDFETAKKSSEYVMSSARTLAHYIRNPLHVLRSSLALMAKMDFSDAPPQTVERLKESAQRNGRLCGEIEGIVDRLFHISTPTKPKLEKTDLKELLAVRVGNYEKLAEENKVDFRFTHEDTPIPIKADKGLLVRAFDVVVENAIEACAASDSCPAYGREVELNLEMEFDVARVNIVDTGPGVDAQYVDRLFDPLFSTKGESDRRGAGLYTARNIILEHRGRIDLDKRQSAKHGARFVIELPLDHSQRRQTEHEIASLV